MARSKQTARSKKNKQKGRGKKEVKDVDENQVAVETTEPSTKRAKLDEAEKSVTEMLKRFYKLRRQQFLLKLIE